MHTVSAADDHRTDIRSFGHSVNSIPRRPSEHHQTRRATSSLLPKSPSANTTDVKTSLTLTRRDRESRLKDLN
jgi:hypothetical protein